MTKINPTKIFENFLDDKNIIDKRLLNFSFDCLGRLNSANGGGDYTALIAKLDPIIKAFAKEISDVDEAVAQQKGKTLTNNQVLNAFAHTMSDNEGFIATVLGGRNTEAYLEFYPKGVMEYSEAGKTDMPTLTVRVYDAAVLYATPLTAPIATLLQSYKDAWANSRSDQDEKKGAVSDNRVERTEARTALESGLLVAVHTIATMFPGDVTKCRAFFDFNLLYGQRHRKHTHYNAAIPVSGQVTVLNQELTDTNTVEIHNPDDNADFQVYLGLNEEAQPGPNAITVKAGATINPKPSQLGSLKNTFLIVKNLSTVNEGAYEITIGEVQHRKKDTPGKGVIN